MSARNQERHWLAALLLMFTALYTLAKPVLWMAALLVLEAGTGEPQWMFVLPFVEGLVCLVIFIAGIQFLAKWPAARHTALASCSALIVMQMGILIIRPRRIVESGGTGLLWLTNKNVSFWIAPIALAIVCVVAILLAVRSERLLSTQ